MAALSGRGLRDLRRRVALLPQDPATTLDPRLTVVESVAEPLLLWGEDAATATTRATELLDAVGAGGRAPTGDPANSPTVHDNALRWRGRWHWHPTSSSPTTPPADSTSRCRRRICGCSPNCGDVSGSRPSTAGTTSPSSPQVADDVLILRRGRVVESGPAHDAC